MRTNLDPNVRATYKVGEAAKVAGCGERSIREGIKSGKIPVLPLSRTILIPRAAFHKWLDSGGKSVQDGAVAA
jgi:excisionase family DNA binding protein